MEHTDRPSPIRKILYTLIYPSCVLFTVIILSLTCIAVAFEMTTFAPSLEMMFKVWLFSLIVSALNRVLYMEKINMFVRLLIHYAGIFGSLIVIFILMRSVQDYKNGAFLLVIVLSVVYFFIAALIILIRSTMRIGKNNQEKYKNQFRG